MNSPLKSSPVALPMANLAGLRVLQRLLKMDGLGVFFVLLGLCVILSAFNSNFLSLSNIASVARAFSYVGIMAIGMTLVIIAGGIDLSVGSVFGLASVVTGFLYVKLSLGLFPSLVFGGLTGVVLGLLNGLLIYYARLPAFIATLGTMSIGRGLAYAISSGYPIAMPSQFNQIGQGEYLGVPYPVLYMLILGLFFAVLLNSTVFGRRIYALGGGELAARISGVNIKNIKLGVYALCGLLSALAGIVTTARLGVAQSTAGLGYELDVIAAVIIGGSSMSGGKGTIFGTLTGAAIMGVLRNGLVLLDVSAY
ncbi:MAG: ABC transporter permease, partial [Proteobacteria bacterium]|nr:ABC transporter permease [Pseudomonadota bacterium]